MESTDAGRCVHGATEIRANAASGIFCTWQFLNRVDDPPHLVFRLGFEGGVTYRARMADSRKSAQRAATQRKAVLFVEYLFMVME